LAEAEAVLVTRRKEGKGKREGLFVATTIYDQER
jgi:hypothetical protein